MLRTRFTIIALTLIAAPALLLAISTSFAEGHEFWIDPVAHQVPVGEPIVAATRVGENFEGSSYSYRPNAFRRFEIAQGDALASVEGRLGDSPALSQTAPADGLAVVVHVTEDSELKYSEFAKFEKFVTHKDARWVLERHRDRDLPEEGFTELYSRYAKSLVAVGGGAGADRDFGLLTEITALANPYDDDLSGGMPVRVTYEGAPRGESQVEVFEKSSEGEVSVFTVTTDPDGRAVVPVKPGHRYMLDAVVLRAPPDLKAATTGAVWESLWANLTFEVPAR